ncbi:MAG: hypothetical protein ACOYJW_05795 [Candidatus Omnitrophota bacterium]|jgi:hypothetical protein
MLSEAKHLERGILRHEPAQDDGWLVTRPGMTKGRHAERSEAS